MFSYRIQGCNGGLTFKCAINLVLAINWYE